jgi:hypothetical protein
MTGFLTSFLLGRPGNEISFDVNPEAMVIEEQPIAVLQRNLAGDLKKSVLKTSAPTIKVNSNYLTPTQRNQFASLVGIQDTFLSFQCRDDFQVVSERDDVSDTSHVIIQNTSATKLSKLLVQNGYPGIITINSVAEVPNVLAGPLYDEGGYGEGGYSGPDFFSGGSYDDLTRTITLGTSLSSDIDFVYVTYTYTGWLVNIEKLIHAAHGGWVNRFTYDFQLTGV